MMKKSLLLVALGSALLYGALPAMGSERMVLIEGFTNTG